MPKRITIEGDTVQDVLDLMNVFPGGEVVEPGNSGFHEDSGDPHADFDFYCGDPVGIVATGETGYVESQQRNLYGPDIFLVAFDSRVDGKPTSKWFAAADLVDVPLN